MGGAAPDLVFCFCSIILVIVLLNTCKNPTSGHYSMLFGFAELPNVLDLFLQLQQLCTSKIGFSRAVLSKAQNPATYFPL